VSRAALLAVLLVVAGPLGAPRLVGAPARAQETGTAAAMAEPLPPEVVRGHCSVCHSYALVAQQRLDRANWDWVMEDMIDKYGATWISPRLRARIVDYLVEHHGPMR
jgi:cytochrome c5